MKRNEKKPVYRVLKPGSPCLSFYDWDAADKFIDAWRAAGFQTVRPSIASMLCARGRSANFRDDALVPLICPTCQASPLKSELASAGSPATVHGVVLDIFVGRRGDPARSPGARSNSAASAGSRPTAASGISGGRG